MTASERQTPALHDESEGYEQRVQDEYGIIGDMFHREPSETRAWLDDVLSALLTRVEVEPSKWSESKQAVVRIIADVIEHQGKRAEKKEEAEAKLARLTEALWQAERTIVNCRAVIMTLEKKPSMALIVVPPILTETGMLLNVHIRPVLAEQEGTL
jgi:hypothetical protein